MKSNISSFVTLNLIQGPWDGGADGSASEAACAPWMLNQVQHDDAVVETGA